MIPVAVNDSKNCHDTLEIIVFEILNLLALGERSKASALQLLLFLYFLAPGATQTRL